MTTRIVYLVFGTCCSNGMLMILCVGTAAGSTPCKVTRNSLFPFADKQKSRANADPAWQCGAGAPLLTSRPLHLTQPTESKSWGYNLLDLVRFGSHPSPGRPLVHPSPWGVVGVACLTPGARAPSPLVGMVSSCPHGLSFCSLCFCQPERCGER